VEAPDADWQRIWEVNLMSHVYAARAVLPAMIERGDGYLLSTASAAGLLPTSGPPLRRDEARRRRPGECSR
jgi:NADP-dependent 3-hydroxy acid dehydrogenase YdfG